MSIDVLEVDGITGEAVERAYTADEAAQREADLAAAAAAQAAAAAAEAQRVADVQESQSELKALGLSDKAIETVSGYPYPYQP